MRKSLENIDLGLGEAQVSLTGGSLHVYCYDVTAYCYDVTMCIVMMPLRFYWLFRL